MRSLCHIAMVSPRFAEGQTVGGAETLLKVTAEKLCKRGIQVTFLTTCAENHNTWENVLPEGRKKVGQIDVIRFPVNSTRNARLFKQMQIDMCTGVEMSREEELLWIRNSVTSDALIDYLKVHQDHFDCVLAGPYLFGLVWQVVEALPEKTLLVPCLHDEGFAYASIMKDMFLKAQGCLYNAEPEQHLAERLYGIAPERGRVVGMGLDSFAFSAERARGALAFEEPYLLYCGRRETGKGTPLMTQYVAAFRERTGRDIRMVFTGSGNIEAPSELYHVITDMGFVDEQTKHDLMAGALAFVHPSTFESFGIVLLESFLAGRPALVHAGSEVLSWQCRRSEGGLWFRHYPDFEEELTFLMDHPDAADAMGRQAQAFVQNEYAWPVVEERLLSALQELGR
ncbi:MAG: glycosyltransferase [Spartobacteria bacterium]|nr:glycosyltransferase [Spartobacteria bacterium]